MERSSLLLPSWRASVASLSGARRGRRPVEMPPPLPPLREQDHIRQEWLQGAPRARAARRSCGGTASPCGSSLCREYNEDPVFFSLVSPSVMAARRRTILVFNDLGPEKGVERLALGGGSNGGLYEVYRDPELEGRELWGQAQWALLRKLVDERRPATHRHRHLAHPRLRGRPLGGRARAARGGARPLDLAAGPRGEPGRSTTSSLRVPEMLPTYRHLMRIVHALIARAFSSEVITPGPHHHRGRRVVAAPAGERPGPRRVVPALGERAAAGGGRARIHGRRRPSHRDRARRPPAHGLRHHGHGPGHRHAARGLRAARPGETRAARRAARRRCANSNRLQDLLLERMRPGRTRQRGARRHAGRDEGGRHRRAPSTRHPIGDHGHGAGPLIGLWDRQQADARAAATSLLLPSTWFSIELQATTPVPEWGNQPVRSAQEEDAVLGEDGQMAWVLERQTRYHLVR